MRRLWKPTWQHRLAVRAISRGADLTRTHGVTRAVLGDLEVHGYAYVLDLEYPELTDDGRALAATSDELGREIRRAS